MTIENVRIAILDAYDNVLAFMDNLPPKALHYYDDTLHEYLKGSTYTYSFSASADHPDSQYLVEGNKLAFVYREKNYYLTIMTVEKDEYTVSCEAFGLPFELLNEDKEAYAAPEAMTFEEYLAVFDPEGIITLGLNEVSEKSITHEWTGTESMLARLYSLATAFDAEVEFQAVLHDNYSLAGITLNVYKEHGDGSQGMGENRMDTILRYGKEVNGVRKTADISELYTAIRPTGKDGLDITSIEINEYDENGNLEYSSPQGNRNIYAVQAKDRFPSNLTAPATERYIALVWSYDTDNVNVLAGQALARLKEVCVPNVRYEVSGHVDANIGDTFVIQDEEYTPQLLLSARVTEQERSFTDPSQNKTVFDNFTELESQISEDLIGRVEELIQANKSYSAYIDSNNGLVFKNNTGSTTLTAKITSGITDVTADMTINWFKDGAAAGSGTTLIVNASDVSETAVYSIQAVNGNGDIVATTQVTIADVYDGAAGQPGPPGTSSYTHIAYANSADGTVDFSVTDSNREYIGFYVDNVQADSTDPSDYKWTLIKGADGSQGVPGTPGADGRTPYFHVAYANSADGHTGFSTTEADGKTYMGTYTDYTADDSDDPDDYLWMKTQGPEGEKGEQGEPGQDGVGVTSVDVQYYSSTSNTSLAGGNWTTTPPEWENGRYIWSKTVITYTNGTTEETQPVCITGAAGQSGSDGSNGVGVSSIVEQYYSSTSPTTPTGGSWSDTYPGWQEGRYIWTRSIITYTDGATTTTTAICVTGPKGDTGATGEPGPAGADGRTTYFHIKYSNNANGNPMTETPSKYIGTYVDFTQADSNDYTDYTWSQFQGDPGAQGIPGTNGENGQTSYLHIAYSNSFDGQTDFSTTDSENKSYIGVYVDFNQSDPNDPSLYTWTKVQGPAGPTGPQGIQGPQGENGQTTYFHVKYSENPDGNPMSETPSTYIGTYVDFVQLDSDDYTDYTWSRFQGMPGDQGIPGTNGTDGKTSYLHIAYANSVDGTVDFSTTDPTGRAYMGTYVDFVQSDSGNPETYTWVKVQGETGPEGQPGQDGTPGKDGKMLYATSLSLSSYATKEAYLQDNQTITDEDLYVGITVSVMFDSGNTASNPQLKLSECSAYPIMCQGLNYAYWRDDQTVVFTWDGTYWRVASEPVYAAMVLVGSATGKNVYVSSSGVAVRDGSEVLALYGETTDIGKADAQHVHIDTDSVDIMDGDQVLASFGVNTIIGDPNGLHTEIGETGFEIAYPISVGTENQIFDKLRLSPGGIAIKTGEETSDDFLQFVVFNTVTDKTDIPGLQKNGFDVPNTRDIQSGISGNYQVAGGQNVQVNVTFPNKYPVGVEPVVVCTAMPATNNQASFESGILNVSRMGFTALVTNRGNSNYTIKLAWMSMTPTE